MLARRGGFWANALRVRTMGTTGASSRVKASKPPSPTAKAPAARAVAFQPELVVFDKDGTLIDFKVMWAKWAHELVDNLEAAGHLDFLGVRKLEGVLGYERATRKVGSRSILCCSPMHEIEEHCVNTIAQHRSLSTSNAGQMLESVWRMPDPRKDSKELTDLRLLFSHLKEELGLKIAVCTTDNREETIATLEHLKVHHMVDMVLCGDEKHVKPKPHPDQLFHICESLGVEPRQTIMVGDTITDMKMAKAAQVGLSIAIPNGAGDTSDLMEHADIILPTMENCGRVITKFSANRFLF